MVTLKRIVFPSFFVVLLFGSCSTETESFPSAVKDFYTAYTSSTGTIESVAIDDGMNYPVLADETKKVLVADSLYRFMGYYQLVSEEGKHGIHIYSAREVFSSYPLPSAEFKQGVKTDPVQVQSIWVVPKYLNMTFNVKNSGAKHVFSFVEDSVVSKGNRTYLYVTLYHDANGDNQAFTDVTLASLPLDRYLKQSAGALSVHFSLNTYDEGPAFYEFDY